MKATVKINVFMTEFDRGSAGIDFPEQTGRTFFFRVPEFESWRHTWNRVKTICFNYNYYTV